MESAHRSLHFSDEFVISCGATTLDIEKSKILLIRCRKTGEHMLPKGRKDIGEGLEQTALRETFEETGFRAKLFAVEMNTLATLPALPVAEHQQRTVTEPIAVSQRVVNGILKIIFWYIAIADSTSAQEEATQQEDEDFDVVWCDFQNINATLSFDDDQRIAWKAIAAAIPNSDLAQRSGCPAPWAVLDPSNPRTDYQR
ncbi:hypothetical protein ACHAQA_000609 [Verticillium albo-atrum]